MTGSPRRHEITAARPTVGTFSFEEVEVEAFVQLRSAFAHSPRSSTGIASVEAGVATCHAGATVEQPEQGSRATSEAQLARGRKRTHFRLSVGCAKLGELTSCPHRRATPLDPMPAGYKVDAELAQVEDRRLAPAAGVGGEREREGHPVRFSEWLAVAQDVVVAGR